VVLEACIKTEIGILQHWLKCVDLFFKKEIPVSALFRVGVSWNGYAIVIEARHDFAQWHTA